MRVRAGIRRSCCDVSFAGFLIACASSRTTALPRDRGDRLDVAHRGAVGGDHDDRRRRPRPRSRRATARFAPWCTTTRSVGREPRRLGGPVADDRGRRDHQRRAVAGAGEQVREHRRRLAEAHVEGEAAAEAGRVEEAEPRERLGLVAAELADEARRARRPARRETFAAAASRSAAQPPPSTEMPPASGEPSRPSARRSISAPESCVVVARSASASAAAFEVGLVDRDPPAAGADQRPRFLGQPRDVGRGELDVVEHRRPADVRRAGWRRRPISDASSTKHAQRRRRLARRQLGHAHVEARRRRAAARSSAISSHASSWLRTTWPRRVPPGRSSAGSMRSRRAISSSRSRRFGLAVDDRLLDRDQRALGAGREHREVPRVAVVGRVELHDQRARARSVTERAQRSSRVDELAGDAHRRVERAAVEAGEERLGDVVGGAHVRRRRGHLDPARAVAADRVDHAGERRAGQRPRVDARIERAARCPASRRPCASSRSASTSAGVQRTENEPLGAARGAAAPPALAQQRHHRAPRGELDRPDRDPAQPADARADRRRPDRRRPRRASPAPRRPESRTRRRAAPPRQRDRGVRIHPDVGAPAAASIAMTVVAVDGGVARPPPQATTRPGSHDTCSWSAPGSAAGSSRSRADPDRRLGAHGRGLAAVLGRR